MINKAIKFSSNYFMHEVLKKMEISCWNNNVLIDPKNEFLNNTSNKIDKLCKNQSFKSKKEYLHQYLAISTIAHCYDGWNLLSRSIESFLNGDISSSIHLAYYSELRAFMSIMASKSIGIFNYNHFYVNNIENFIALKDIGTHEIVKELYKVWSTDEDEILSISSFISFNHIPLKNWIDIIPTYHTTTKLVINDWLQTWGLDFGRLNDDRKLRNEMSYRPRFTRSEIPIKDSLSKIMSIWKGLAPSSDNRFQDIDMHLYRCAIEKIIIQKLKIIKRISVLDITKKSEYKDNLLSMFRELGIPNSIHTTDFFQRISTPNDHIIIEEAKKKNTDDDPLPMICRSILLLRIATGKTDSLISKSNVNTESLNFWWKSVAYNMGIIDSKEFSPDPIDLFIDVKESIDTIENDLLELSNLNQVLLQEAKEINFIKQFQRVCFWGLGL